MNGTACPLRVGLIGTGRISDICLRTCAKHDAINIVTCGSLDLHESRAKAGQHGIRRVRTPEEIIPDAEIDAILNLTVPAAHADVSLSALESGRHVYSEKPPASSLIDGKRVLTLADARGLVTGSAPDTSPGGRRQTVCRLLDDGMIGRPSAVAAYVGSHGTERHNPNPGFHYQPGDGPMLDPGPYYLTATVFLLGPVARVADLSNRALDWRMTETGLRQGRIRGLVPVGRTLLRLVRGNGKGRGHAQVRGRGRNDLYPQPPALPVCGGFSRGRH